METGTGGKEERSQCLLCAHICVCVCECWLCRREQNHLAPLEYVIISCYQRCPLLGGVFPNERRPQCPVGADLTSGDRTWRLRCPFGLCPVPFPTSYPLPLVVTILAANLPPPTDS